jgi:hypothetical protein
MSAAEFNARRADAHGDIRKMRTDPSTAPPVRSSGTNPSWPWLPPGQHGDDPALRRLVAGLGAGCARAQASERAVAVQVAVVYDAIAMVGADEYLSTMRMSPSAARLLAAQLLQAAHEAES